jgi:hypothetical protein
VPAGRHTAHKPLEITSLRGPPSAAGSSCPVSPSMPACRARTAPDLDGSITNATVSAALKTHSHHFAGPFCPSPGQKTRQVG